MILIILLLGDKEWKKYFYRLVDSLETENGEKLRNIEEVIFKNLVNDKVEKASGPWECYKSKNTCCGSQVNTEKL